MYRMKKIVFFTCITFFKSVLKNRLMPKFKQQWVIEDYLRMPDAQEGLGITNMSDLLRKYIHGMFEIQNPIKDQIRK